MIRGLYTAASGMLTQSVKLDTISNNLANVNSGGFKKDLIVTEAFPNMLLSRIGEIKTNPDGTAQLEAPVPIGGLGTGAVIGGVFTDFSEGYLKRTDNPCDLALTGPGFFVLETLNGIRYTRCGEFILDSEGNLTSKEGYPVLGDDGETINITESFTVDNNGNVSSNGQVITKIWVVNFDDYDLLQKEGQNLSYTAEAANDIENPGVQQGYLEESNVNAVSEMITMINVMRNYESLQKVIQSEDDTLGTLIDQVGSV